MIILILVLQVLYTKLFFVLGLLWSFEGIHAVLIRDGPDFENPFLHYFFLTVDILNLLRGVFMFLIFVCKKTVWLKMRKWMRRRGRMESSRSSTHPKALSLESTFSSSPTLQHGGRGLGETARQPLINL